MRASYTTTRKSPSLIFHFTCSLETATHGPMNGEAIDQTEREIRPIVLCLGARRFYCGNALRSQYQLAHYVTIKILITGPDLSYSKDSSCASVSKSKFNYRNIKWYNS